MKEKYLIIYDYCDPVSDDYSVYNIQDIFEGTYTELQKEIARIKESNCYYNIEATYIL